MKRVVFSILLVAVLISSVFCMQGSAESAEIIDSAVIDAVLNSDGTVNITEKWTVSYIVSADNFYRNIDIYTSDSDLALIQKYDEVKDVSVKIDGVEAAESPSGVNTFSFMQTSDRKSYEINIHCPSAQTTREYEISYTLTGALKKSSGDAVFSYMLLGKEFLYTSNNVTATVHFPTNAENIQIPEGMEGIVEGYTAKFEAKRVYNTFAVEVSADKDAFEKDALASYSSALENMSKVKNVFVSILPYIACAIAVIAIIFFVLIPDRFVRFSLERRALRLVNADAESAKLPDGITACEAYKMLIPESRIRPKTTVKKVPALFAMAILECIENGYIIPDADKLIVGRPNKNAPAYIMSVLNFLMTFSDKKGGSYIIDADFAEKVTAECMGRYDVITNYLATFYSLIPEANFRFFRNNLNKEKYENAYVVKVKASGIKQKPTFAQCLGDVLSGRKTGEAEIFAMLLSSASADKMFDKGGRKGEKALCEALNAMYNVFVKSK